MTEGVLIAPTPFAQIRISKPSTKLCTQETDKVRMTRIINIKEGIYPNVLINIQSYGVYVL